jgi:hypothetical protein
MHVSRAGALEPYGDKRDVLSQTKQGLNQAVRERLLALGAGRVAPKVEPTNIGIALMTSMLASAPICFGNKRVARRGGPTNTGTGPVNLRSTDRHRLAVSAASRSLASCATAAISASATVDAIEVRRERRCYWARPMLPKVVLGAGPRPPLTSSMWPSRETDRTFTWLGRLELRRVQGTRANSQSQCRSSRFRL